MDFFLKLFGENENQNNQPGNSKKKMIPDVFSSDFNTIPDESFPFTDLEKIKDGGGIQLKYKSG